MERETKTFTTKGGHVIVHKTYITGREFNGIQDIYLSLAKFSLTGKQMDTTFDASIQTKATEKSIEIIVVSVDGKTENVLNDILDLPVNEYQEVVKEVQGVSEKKNE